MGKCSNAFFSETTNMIKAKLYMNVYWMVLYKLHVFCSWISDRYKKQRTFQWSFLGSLVSTVLVVSEKKRFETLHRLTLDPMGKCSNAFFSETTNIIKAKLYMNVYWMVLYKLYVSFQWWMHSLGSISAIASEKNIFLYFPHMVLC
jgi:hypothetical protein